MEAHSYINLTGEEINSLNRSNTIIVLPAGSIEQHGPHLPVDTDTLTAVHVAQRLADTITTFNLIITPPFRYSYAKPSLVYPGTLSIEGETLIKLSRDVMRGFIEQGFKHILVINAHMENTDFMIEGISLALKDAEAVKILLANWWELVDEKDLIEIFGPDWRGWVDEHAALVETSLMMHIAPDLVREEKIVDDRRKSKYEFRIFPWNLANYPATGAFAPTQGASPEKGVKLAELVVKEVGKLVQREFSE
jgi:creatinine amidohydrolase